MQYEEFIKRLGLKIKYYRSLKSITQIRLAEKLGMDEYYISNIENGKVNLTMKTLYKIIDILQIDSSKLFDFSD